MYRMVSWVSFCLCSFWVLDEGVVIIWSIIVNGENRGRGILNCFLGFLFRNCIYFFVYILLDKVSFLVIFDFKRIGICYVIIFLVGEFRIFDVLDKDYFRLFFVF